MKKYLITAAAILCGIALMSCSDSSNDNTSKLIAAYKASSSSSGTSETTPYTDATLEDLKVQYVDFYDLMSDTNFSKDIENLKSRICFGKEVENLDYYEVVVHDEGNTDSYHKATYYLLKEILSEDGIQEDNKVIGMGVYIRDSVNKVKTLFEYSFDGEVTKAAADANPGNATFAYYETFDDEALTKSKVRCIYCPKDSNRIDTLQVTTYSDPTGTEDSVVEDTYEYLPYNLKWNEVNHKEEAIDTSLVSNEGKVTLADYKGTEYQFDFPVIADRSLTYHKLNSAHPYDYEVVMNNDFQRIYTEDNKYNFCETRYYMYEFTWNIGVCADSYIQQVCWNLNKSGDSEINLSDPSTYVIDGRCSTLIKDYKKFGGSPRLIRYTWFNAELKTNYYRTFDYEPFTKSDETPSDTEYYEYMYKYYISDDTSDYPTHLALIREGHQDYINGNNVYGETCYSNNEKTTESTPASDISVGLPTDKTARTRVSFASDDVKSAFASTLPEARIGYANR